MFAISMVRPVIQVAAGVLLQYVNLHYLADGNHTRAIFLIGLASGVFFGLSFTDVMVAIKEHRERKAMRRRLAELQGNYDFNVEAGTSLPITGPNALLPKGSGHAVIKDAE